MTNFIKRLKEAIAETQKHPQGGPEDQRACDVYCELSCEENILALIEAYEAMERVALDHTCVAKERGGECYNCKLIAKADALLEGL